MLTQCKSGNTQNPDLQFGFCMRQLPPCYVEDKLEEQYEAAVNARRWWTLQHTIENLLSLNSKIKSFI